MRTEIGLRKRLLQPEVIRHGLDLERKWETVNSSREVRLLIEVYAKSLKLWREKRVNDRYKNRRKNEVRSLLLLRTKWNFARPENLPIIRGHIRIKATIGA